MITTRPITKDEIERFREQVERGFGDDLAEEDRNSERFLALMPLDLTVAAYDGDEMVGTLAAFEFDVTVPGGAAIAMTGTTVVTVQPTHRRQGVLSAMMQDHLDAVARRGDALVGLWASETGIYGRFGFGHATSRDEVEAPTLAVTIATASEGTVRLIDPDSVVEVFPSIYDTARRKRAGMLSRRQDWWAHSVVHDPPHRRDGMSAKRFAVYQADGSTEGYVIYVQKSDWSGEVPLGQVKVIEAISTSDRAHTGLWQYLASIDLYPRIRWWNLPVDDPLWWKLAEPRRLVRKRGDALWVRIMDVPAALEARSYETDGSIRLAVEDLFRPDISGVYELAVSDGVGKCVAVDGNADVSLGVDALGALYLGGSNAVSMAAAG
ncbi:MAG: GNAT family N-acetyltransferase, partial [Acidimicrobiia bacterium]